MNFSFGQQQPQQQQPFQLGQQPLQMGQQPFQLGQQPLQMGQQSIQTNLLQQQELTKQLYHREKSKQSLNKIYSLQNQPELQALIQVLLSQQKLIKDQLQKAMDQSNIKVMNPAEIEDLYRRGQKIKQKNTVLLHRLFLIKSKLERLMYQDMNPHSKYEYETAQALDKIRTLKSEITQKCAYLKTLKFNKSNNFVEKRPQSRKSNFSNIGTALTELKNGTEVLEREVLKQKTQMQLLSQYLNERS